MVTEHGFDGLLLDVGGPMMPLPFEFLGDVERAFGLDPGTITWGGPFRPGGDPLWRERDAGRVTEREYWRQWAAMAQTEAGRTESMRDFLAACFRDTGVSPIRPATTALVADARAAGLKVGALTNDASWILPGDFLGAVSIFSELDAVVDLSSAGVFKPQPEAYAMALEELDLSPGRVLFVDDQPLNVAGAEACGVHALHFDITDVVGSIRRIRECLRLSADAHRSR